MRPSTTLRCTGLIIASPFHFSRSSPCPVSTPVNLEKIRLDSSLTNHPRMLVAIKIGMVEMFCEPKVCDQIKAMSLWLEHRMKHADGSARHGCWWLGSKFRTTTLYLELQPVKMLYYEIFIYLLTNFFIVSIFAYIVWYLMRLKPKSN